MKTKILVHLLLRFSDSLLKDGDTNTDPKVNELLKQHWFGWYLREFDEASS